MLIKKLSLIVIIIIEINNIGGKITRIVNGVNVRPGEIPYQVSIQDETSSHFCGGVILNRYFIITAAHCAQYRPKDIMQIIVGTINFDKIYRLHNIIQIYVHEHFQSLNGYKFLNDIALMKVDPIIKFDHMTSSIRLPSQGLVIPHKKKAIATGWGRLMGPKSIHPKKLKKVEVQVLNQEVCVSHYESVNRFIHPKQLCTFMENHERKGACNGDSGGPLVIDENILIGISSWSRKDPNCASPIYPDVYTRVSEYINWINSRII